MKKTPLRKKAKSKTRGWYSNKIDEMAKRFAKERDCYICQYSGEQVSGSNAHGSHVIPVSAGLFLRWDLQNIKCLSYHNHINWWHKNPVESGGWFKTFFPDRWEYLQSKRNKLVKITDAELKELYQEAKKCTSWEEYEKTYKAWSNSYFWR